MWYDNFVKSDLDGLIPLLNLFNSEEEFIIYFFKSVKFFNVEQVKEQAKVLLEQIENKDKIPVRYSNRSKTVFYHTKEVNIKGVGSKGFKNRKEAKNFSSLNDMFHNETKIKVCIDKDGNYYVREQIFKSTGYKVSQGSKSDFQNYVISHVWAKTDNPLFFTSLWNIILVPNHLAFILDKPDSNSEIVRKIKITAKAICHHLYNPNELIMVASLQTALFDSEELKLGVKLAKIFLKDQIISFIDQRISNSIIK